MILFVKLTVFLYQWIRLGHHEKSNNFGNDPDELHLIANYKVDCLYMDRKKQPTALYESVATIGVEVYANEIRVWFTLPA